MPINRDRAVAAAMEVAAAQGLVSRDAVVLHESNRIAVRLLPCDALARVAEAQFTQSAAFEVRLALQLAAAGAPVGALDPRVTPVAYQHGDFAVTLWTYYEPAPARGFTPADYAHALERQHGGLRRIDIPVPHFTWRVSEARRIVGDRDLSPALAEDDRAFLGGALQSLQQAISARAAPEQPLHGEPHAGNVLRTNEGLRFIDLETCCRGPVEFDIAHAPEEVSGHYPGADQALVRTCRILMLAMVAAWRWDRDDRFPDGAQAGRDFIGALREALAGGPVAALPGWDD